MILQRYLAQKSVRQDRESGRAPLHYRLVSLRVHSIRGEWDAPHVRL
jgi:hypothetical protein